MQNENDLEDIIKNREYRTVYLLVATLANICAAKEDKIIELLTGYLWDKEEAGCIKSLGEQVTFEKQMDLPEKPDRQTAVMFRSQPASLSEREVKNMIKSYNFFDLSRNKRSYGFGNQYKTETIKGDKIVIDEASGLIWQQSGSPDSIRYKAIQKWIEDLNREGYAGYHDWRLPTLEEAMSLIEPEPLNGELYIDPVFDTEQQWIWTSDSYSGAAGAQWVVFFYPGGCYYYFLFDSSYVRAVRFGHSSP